MKKYLILLIICCTQNLISQNVEPSEKDLKIYNSNEVVVRPEFPGGINEFKKFIVKNFIRSDKATPGRVIISFVVEPDGSLTDIKILRNNSDPATGNEAVRVLSVSPKWAPAEKDGKKVRYSYAIPIVL